MFGKDDVGELTTLYFHVEWSIEGMQILVNKLFGIIMYQI